MEDFGVHKRRRRLGKEKSKITKKRDQTKISPPRISATKLIRKVNKTQRLYEKHSSNQNITHKRMTIRPGIFNRGKCTSFVHRVELSPEKKARIDADLHRIIQLANGPSALHPVSSENLKKNTDEITTQRRLLDKRKEAVRVEGNKNGDSLLLYGNMESEGSELNLRFQRNSCDSLDFGRGEEKEVSLPCSKRQKSIQNTSSSSSSSCVSATIIQSEIVNYSNPSLKVYEEFADCIVSVLHSKQKSLFPCRDYLQEARHAMKSKCNFSQLHFKTFEEEPEPACRETEKKGNENISGLWLKQKNSPLPMMIDQTVGTSARFPSKQPQIAREYSPIAITLSPRTTILNPMEYLKRVEKSTKEVEKNTKQVERHTSDRISDDSNLPGFPGKSFLYAGYDMWNPFYGLIDVNNSNIYSPGRSPVSQKMTYKHYNRCYIDSPQAVEFKEAKFLAPQSQQQLAEQFSSHSSGVAVNSNDAVRHSSTSQRLISDMVVDSQNVGFDYLMNVSALPEASANYDCCDLLDDLDAANCNLITDKKVFCVNTIERKPSLNKWCPPPSPDMADHKFYRRKMF